MQILFGFGIALLFSFFVIPVVLKMATCYGWYDSPDICPLTGEAGRRIHKTPTPRLGGIAIFAGFALAYILIPTQKHFLAPVLVSNVIFLVGLSDDIFQLSAKLRASIQLVCALITVGIADLSINSIAVLPDVVVRLPGPVGLLLSVFIIVGAINALNMADGLDGLAGGIALISIALLSFLIFFATRELELILFLTLPLIGTILGFLKYNTFPARIFMGDSGSNWLGFMIGVMIVMAFQTQPQEHLSAAFSRIPAISILLCFALPIADTSNVLIQRYLSGQRLMSADKRHLHHTLLRLGFSHSQAVVAIYFLALLSGILGLLPFALSRENLIWLPYLVAVSLVLFFAGLRRVPDNFFETFHTKILTLVATRKRGRHFNLIARRWESLNRFLIHLIFLASPVLAGVPPKEVGYASLMGISLIVISLCLSSRSNDFFDTLLMSLGAIVLLTANNQHIMAVMFNSQRLELHLGYNLTFVVLFLSSIGFTIFTLKKRYFVFTPSDFLLLSLPMLLLLVPDPLKGEYRLNAICLKSLVVFMALRSTTRRRKATLTSVKLVILSALVYVSLVSLGHLRLVY